MDTGWGSVIAIISVVNMLGAIIFRKAFEHIDYEVITSVIGILSIGWLLWRTCKSSKRI